jgi:hypothetical protein
MTTRPQEPDPADKADDLTERVSTERDTDRHGQAEVPTAPAGPADDPVPNGPVNPA